MVLLIPKNTNRIVYRLYDYQMYISNEIRDAQNPSLPALTAFQRYKFFGFQEVQGRIMIANPGGLRELSFEKLQARKPEEIINHAVKGMLPKGKLGRQMFKKLKVYVGPEHAHAAQKPETLEI